MYQNNQIKGILKKFQFLRNKNGGKRTSLWGDILRKHSFIFRCHFKLNLIAIDHFSFLNFLRLKVSIIDKFKAPGDTLLTGIVCRNVKKKFSHIRINCITPNPELLRYDPDIDCLNGQETFFSLPVWYLDVIDSKDPKTNVLGPIFDKLGIKEFDYHARFYLLEKEKKLAKNRLKTIKKPIIAINVVSGQKVKNWPIKNWQKLVDLLTKRYSIIQLGDDKEPYLDGAISFAGDLSMRESVAILAHAKLYIGPDSFLMHAANGVNVPSVIIFGGRTTPSNSGYRGNKNIYVKTDCSPCWIHNTENEQCLYDMKCMKMITPEMVYHEVLKALNQKS